MANYTRMFEVAKFARLISIVIYSLTLFPLMIFEGKGIFISIGLLICGFTIGREYRCPYCKHIFNLRIAPRKIKHCNNCGNKL